MKMLFNPPMPLLHPSFFKRKAQGAKGIFQSKFKFAWKNNKEKGNFSCETPIQCATFSKLLDHK